MPVSPLDIPSSNISSDMGGTPGVQDYPYRVSAYGGITLETGIYKLHIFEYTASQPQEFVITEGGYIDILLVAGGGGGSAWINSAGGGGGGGGVIYKQNLRVFPEIHYVVIGNGGGYGYSLVSHPTSGGNTVFYSKKKYPILFTTGGGRAHYQDVDINGGCGGGAHGGYGVYTPGQGIDGQGFRGGNNDSIRAGGGGGAGQVGNNATATLGGNGGNGLLCNITGSDVYYGGGGGGGPNGIGGLGGGGKAVTINGYSGVHGLGGGGGGTDYSASSNRQSGPGGSGLLVIRYRSVFE